MGKKIALLIAALVGSLIVVVLIANISLAADNQYDNFAQCLTDNGTTMYGTSWCSYCNKQKDLFGGSFDKVDFVDCDKDKETCDLNGVKGYPTWKINGETYSGQQSLERLSQISGCEL